MLWLVSELQKVALIVKFLAMHSDISSSGSLSRGQPKMVKEKVFSQIDKSINSELRHIGKTGLGLSGS
jgi:hypothetical protein